MLRAVSPRQEPRAHLPVRQALRTRTSSTPKWWTRTTRLRRSKQAHSQAEQKENPHQQPSRVTDKRRLDPETGQPRDSAEPAEGQATAEDREAAAGDPLADPLAEAERILLDIPEEDAEDVEQIGD